MAAAPPKPSPKITRETWADWLPDVEPTLTVDDVIARLQERGVDVTVETIRLWQRENVLPAPIRRRIGTGRGGSHSLYPPEVIEAITQIRALQGTGVRLRDMRSHLARMFGLNKGPISHPLSGHAAGTSSVTAELTVSDSTELKTTDSAIAAFQTAHAHGEAPPITATVGSAPTTHTRTVRQSAAVSVNDPALLVAVQAAAKRQEQRTGAPIRRVTVTFTDTQDTEHSYVFTLEIKS